VAYWLVHASKHNPVDLPPGTIPDCRPVNIDNAERRLITRAYFDEELQEQEAYNNILELEQNGVRVQGGISITAFGVQAVFTACPGVGVLGGYI